MKQHFKKILIANRGEIACRVIRTCRKLGILTCAVHSTADKDSMHVAMADEAVLIGEPPATLSYLDMDKVIAAAKQTGCDAIHPGYGFLSENPDFARKCSSADIVFIGPSPDTMHAVGNKQAVKQMLTGEGKHDQQVPTIPGYSGSDQSVPTLKRECLRIGFPCLIKAAAGGGGKGMRVVRKPEEVEASISSVKSEAKNSFGNDDVLLERYFESCRHVEIQIMGDNYGHIVYLGERDCSVQRRYQKVIEETPCPIMTPELRERMGKSAVAIAQRTGYVGAGTVEFLVDQSREFFFLEVNTRLQVEHPITEIVQGLDLVKVQIQVAQGYSLKEIGLSQGRPIPSRTPNYAIECRLYAEDPSNNFFPCTGRLLSFIPYEAEGLRYDTGVSTGSDITVHYDPMIAKVIAVGDTRAEALQRMRYALTKTVVQGLQTNKDFLLAVLDNKEFAAGNYNTRFIDQYFPPDKRKRLATEDMVTRASIAGMLWDWDRRQARRPALRHMRSGWGNARRRWQSTIFDDEQHDSAPVVVRYKASTASSNQMKNPSFSVIVEHGTPFTMDTKEAPDGDALDCALVQCETDGRVVCEIQGRKHIFHVAAVFETSSSGVGDEDTIMLHIHSDECGSVILKRRSRFSVGTDGDGASGAAKLVAPIPCKILKVLVNNGDAVKKGQLLVVVESMKMEMKLYAEMEGIANVAVKPNQIVPSKTVLVTLDQE